MSKMTKLGIRRIKLNILIFDKDGGGSSFFVVKDAKMIMCGDTIMGSCIEYDFYFDGKIVEIEFYNWNVIFL